MMPEPWVTSRARASPGPDTTPPGRSPADTELIAALQATVTDLRTRLDAEGEARRRADHIILELSRPPPELGAGNVDHMPRSAL